MQQDLKKYLVGTLILSKKSAAKNLWRQAFFLMHWPSLLYGYWFSNDYFLLAYAFGKRVIMGPKYFSGPIWIFKFCETIISILSTKSESTRIILWNSGSGGIYENFNVTSKRLWPFSVWGGPSTMQVRYQFVTKEKVYINVGHWHQVQFLTKCNLFHLV